MLAGVAMTGRAGEIDSEFGGPLGFVECGMGTGAGGCKLPAMTDAAACLLRVTELRGDLLRMRQQQDQQCGKRVPCPQSEHQGNTFGGSKANVTDEYRPLTVEKIRMLWVMPSCQNADPS